MSVIISGTQLRTILFGTKVEKSTGTLTVATISLFTVTGDVVLTNIVGKVTTAVTVANSYKLQHNPTTGTTGDIFAATDIGTTDSPAGNLISVTGVATDVAVSAVGRARVPFPIVLTAGVIESVSAGTDGVINWILTYVPLSDDGLIVAA